MSTIIDLPMELLIVIGKLDITVHHRLLFICKPYYINKRKVNNRALIEEHFTEVYKIAINEKGGLECYLNGELYYSTNMILNPRPDHAWCVDGELESLNYNEFKNIHK